MLPEQQQRILGYFIEEARDHLNTIEQGLLNLESTLNDPEMVNEVFRAAHSIKGGAAMLGLSSIQHTSHRLEDCFKVLKEHPVKIDQKLESLFLGVSDTLKSLLEHLSGPFGLSEEAANTLMSEAEPVFKWLNEHLELLVQQGISGSDSPAPVQPLPADSVSTLTELFLRRDIPDLEDDAHNTFTEIPFSVASQAARSPVTPRENHDWAEFQTQVLQALREMLQLFKQKTTPESRQNLQQCCQQLVKLGETWNLPNWCSLCEAAASAIANPDNTYLTLAKIVITEIKQAQELVFQSREAEIAISQQLEGLLSFPEIDLLEITTDLLDERLAIITEPAPTLSANITTYDRVLPDTTNNFASDATVLQPTDSITSLTELSEQLNLDQYTQGVTENNVPANLFFSSEDDAHFSSRSNDHHGPEVGLAELNTLADLFEGETPELDENWQQEEVLDIAGVSELGIELNESDIEDADSELADFLSFDEDTSSDEPQISPTTTEDLNLLFGENFLEKENSELQTSTSAAISAALLEEFAEISHKSQLSSVEIAPKDVVGDLLAIAFDENEALSLGKVTQPETEIIASIELSTSQQNSFDDLFQETVNADSVEEISPPQPDTLSLDNLFTNLEENTALPTNESEISDLFAASPATPIEFSQTDDDLSNFWNQGAEAEQQSEFDSAFEQDVARALEESLFAAAASGEIFGEIQQSTPSPTTSSDIQDFDLTFQQPQPPLDLSLPSDSGDDLFEELAATNSTISPTVDDNDIFLPEIRSFSQEPEALDFIPEFTNQPPDNSFIDSPQPSADLEIELFETLDANSNENPQILFEDIAATQNLTDIQQEIIENLDGDDLFATETTLDINIGNTSDLQELPSHQEILDININGSQEAIADVPEITELNLVDDLFGSETDYSAATSIQDFDTIASQEAIAEIPEITELSLVDDLFGSETDYSAATSIQDFDTIASQEAIADIPEITELSLVDDLFGSETDHSAATPEELVATSDFSDTLNVLATADLSELMLDISEISEAAPVIEEETTDTLSELEIPISDPVVTSQPHDTCIQDEFADLEALLEEEVTQSTNDSFIAEDFAALEALLGADNNEEVAVANDRSSSTPYAQQLRPAATTHTDSNAVSSPAIKDEFSDLEKLLAEADQTISHSASAKQNTGKIPRPSTRRTARFEETMKVPVKQLDDMSNLVGELVVNRNTLEQDHERLRQSLDNLLIQVQQLSDVGARMQELYERSLLEASLLATRKTQETNIPVTNSDTDRGFSELEMDRFTPFHTLSQEMIELIVRVRESASDIDFVTEETERVARQFRQVTTQLQEGLTRARMVPFSQAIDRLRRGVRDNAIKYGKQVELIIEGGDTLIDKMILDHLTDPLTHMLNNAIAHGIETPEVRQAAGKLPVGVIAIRAFHQGNQTVISVGDDGAGIDTEKVKSKAIKIGMITAEQARTISRMEVYDLLFQSGFSIKDKADEISGRGVGMDVVRSEISEIRGIVNTDSALGKGTTFTIRLPLTLSICKALCCVSDKARIAFPMDGVEDTLDIHVKNIQNSADGQSFISWRDTVLPFRPLKDLLTFNRHISRGGVYGGNRDDDMISVVVVRSGNTLIALQIDQVLSEQEIVIKQFEGPAPKPIGVAGATVLGDGRIMPIADVLEIIDIFQGRISKHSGGTPWQQKGTPNVPETPAVKIDPTVLIVDDSITVRELLSLTFNKAGYRVEQARDGQEAWDKLRSGLPCDIVFCDIEMPRCDGLELLSRIQKDSNLNHLPIAMLTSRGADKHRQMAIQLGASGYFTKPYLEEALLEAAVRMLKGEKLVNSTNA
nr:response regulator [Dendronalium sp. ChiSLP03b]MDZ8208757.1 response regulator [Dendronalium sp. ChiSLP03b]